MISYTNSLIMCKNNTHTHAHTLSPLTPTTATGLLNFLSSDWEVGDRRRNRSVRKEGRKRREATRRKTRRGQGGGGK